MTKQEKLALTKENMRLVRHHYERLLTEYEAATGSRGLVAAWGRVGSRSGVITRPTQERALASIAAEEHRRAMRGWFECVRGTYLRLAERAGKSPNLWRHQMILARALQLYVFEKADAEMLALVLGMPKKLNRRRVSAILCEASEEVATDAERLGLFREKEAKDRTGG